MTTPISPPALLEPTDLVRLRKRLIWPRGTFAVYDPPGSGPHDPVYLRCPDGLLIPFNALATESVDYQRAEWFAEVLNAALPEANADAEARRK